MVVLICGILEAAAIIIASVSVHYLSSSLQRKYKTSFFSYGNENHNLKDLFCKAKNEIYIIANCGNKLLEEHKNTLEACLKRNVKINILILDKNTFPIMDQYVSGTGSFDIVKDSLQILENLKSNYRDKIEIRQSSNFFTQSYICIDIDKPTPTSEWNKNCIIQVMLYQFMTPTKESAMTYFYPAKDEKEFGTTVRSIHNLWNSCTELNTKKYFEYSNNQKLEFVEE